MENPFAKLVKEEEPSEDSNVVDFAKAKRLKELKDWKAQVETGMKMESHPDDARKIEEISAMIRQLEEEQ